MTHESDPTCDFCQIARGNAPADVIAEAERWVAFFPLEPATPGHTLVIPKAHYTDLWAIDEPDLAAELINATIAIGQSIERAIAPQGMNLVTSAGSAAEQTVFHLHLHVVPRWTTDGFGRIWPTGDRYDISDLQDVADLVRQAWLRN